MLKSYETADFKIKLNDKLSYISLGYWAVVSFYDFQKVQIFFSCQLLFFIVYTQSPSQPVLASCPWGGWSVYLLWISNCPDNVGTSLPGEGEKEKISSIIWSQGMCPSSPKGMVFAPVQCEIGYVLFTHLIWATAFFFCHIHLLCGVSKHLTKIWL